MENEKVTFDFYGVKVCVCGYGPTADNIARDFEYFACPANGHFDVILNINFTVPPYEKIPEICASLYKPDCVSYDKNGIRYVDYSGKALVIYDKSKNGADFFSVDEDLLYEIVYLFIHSRVGELLDLKGIHRIHACSFSFEGKIYVCMLPQGGGKSTLLVELLKNEKIKILSDDTPLTGKGGRILPFPIRIGVHEDIDTSYIPENQISFFNRRKFGLKKLINYGFFKDRIENEDKPVIFICGVRMFSDEPRIKKSGRFTCFSQLFKNCVIGYGLPQVLEYFLSGGFKDNFGKAAIVFSRLYSCLKLVLIHRKTYVFYLSKDKKKNAAFLTGVSAKL